WATRSSASAPKGWPVLGLRSQRGKQLEVICSPMRWPALKTLLVAHRSITYSYGRPGSIGEGGSLCAKWRLRACTIPWVRLNERPLGMISTNRATKSVSGADETAQRWTVLD